MTIRGKIMSDIQRYVVEDEVALADNYDNEGLLKLVYLSAVVVKYDDHIAEVERLTKRLESALKHSIAIQDDHTALQARIDKLQNMLHLKAEGIREMLHGDKIPSQSGEKGSRWSNWKIIETYADKLEKSE
jgi:hypothetical protein